MIFDLSNITAAGWAILRRQGKTGIRFAPSSCAGDAKQSRGRRPPPWESPNGFVPSLRSAPAAMMIERDRKTR
jgi:hypothetical protein